MKKVTVLDYGSGNVFSLVNALKYVGYSVHLIKSGAEISRAENIVLPGVGAFANCMDLLSSTGCLSPLVDHVNAGKKMLASHKNRFHIVLVTQKSYFMKPVCYSWTLPNLHIT